MRKLKHATVKAITIDPNAGARIDLVHTEALILALEEEVDVVYYFNGQEHRVSYDALLKFKTKVN